MKRPIQVIYYYMAELREIRVYFGAIERLMREETQTYLKSVSSEDEPGGNRFDYRRDMASMLEDGFPQYYRVSSLLVFWGIFEENFHHLCMSLSQHGGWTEMEPSGKDNGIDKYRKYLVEIVGWTIPNAEWQQLKNIQKIRNIFAHRSGYLKESNEAGALNLNISLVSVSPGAREKLNLNSDYIRTFLDTVEAFWLSLEKECQKTLDLDKS